MEIKQLHGWQLGVKTAMDTQRRLADLVSKNNEVADPRFIAGVDMAVGKAGGMATGAVVVLSYPELRVVETRVVKGELEFPYIPGLLSFREMPLILAACAELGLAPDLFLVDGQGVAHPRRLGLASHLGLFLDRPTIGCAKSRLCGSHETLCNESGSQAVLKDDDETIGVVLRTRAGVKPVYVSIGHKVDLAAAVQWVMACGRGYRLPEPVRLAHLAAGGHLVSSDNRVMSVAGSRGKPV